MAKKKPPPKCPLTDEHVRELGEHVHSSTINIYPYVKQKYGVEVNDAVFDKLRELCGLKRCIECNTFLETNDFEDGDDMCIDCHEGAGGEGG